MPLLIKAFLIVLPEFLKMIKIASVKIGDGIEDAVIKRSLEKTREAFALKDRAEAARKLSESVVPLEEYNKSPVVVTASDHAGTPPTTFKI